jgi:hypothetical protein
MLEEVTFFENYVSTSRGDIGTNIRIGCTVGHFSKTTITSEEMDSIENFIFEFFVMNRVTDFGQINERTSYRHPVLQ